MIRLRQILDRVGHRLQFVPLGFIIAGIVLSQIALRIDRSYDTGSLPQILTTTVDSGRAILSAIAGGLIASVTLLLSLMLVAVQLASSQFSPRTLRNWTGDRTQQTTIGFVLGTTVYCLLVMREVRSFDEGEALTPHVSVILAVVLGVVSLVAVVLAVDHLTNRLRIGSVAATILAETEAIITADDRVASPENPSVVPAGRPAATETEPRPSSAHPIEAPKSGWIQQVDTGHVFDQLDDGATCEVVVAVGSFTYAGIPVAWYWGAEPSDECADGIRGAFAIGDTRTMQQDIGFGILQMVDIALRALSPGVNDPNTANDMIVHLGAILLQLWERPLAPSVRSEDGRTLIRHELTHGEYLASAIDPIRRLGGTDPLVAATLVRTLLILHEETKRRDLPGPVEPIEAAVEHVLWDLEHSDLPPWDRASVTDLVPDGWPDT